ncbi:hypothetical protein GSY69_13270, partial [Brevibacterium sp. 5221]|nr:hypothetical protein [Brevibacterium rongguiense]
LAAARRAERGPVVGALLERELLVRALGDLDWVAQGGEVPVSCEPARAADAELVAAASAALDLVRDAGEAAAPGDDESAVLCLRVPALVVEAGIAARPGDVAEAPAAQRLERQLLSALSLPPAVRAMLPGGEGVLRRAGGIPADLADRTVRALQDVLSDPYQQLLPVGADGAVVSRECEAQLLAAGLPPAAAGEDGLSLQLRTGALERGMPLTVDFLQAITRRGTAERLPARIRAAIAPGLRDASLAAELERGRAGWLPAAQLRPALAEAWGPGLDRLTAAVLAGRARTSAEARVAALLRWAYARDAELLAGDGAVLLDAEGPVAGLGRTHEAKLAGATWAAVLGQLLGGIDAREWHDPNAGTRPDRLAGTAIDPEAVLDALPAMVPPAAGPGPGPTASLGSGAAAPGPFAAPQERSAFAVPRDPNPFAADAAPDPFAVPSAGPPEPSVPPRPPHPPGAGASEPAPLLARLLALALLDLLTGGGRGPLTDEELAVLEFPGRTGPVFWAVVATAAARARPDELEEALAGAEALVPRAAAARRGEAQAPKPKEVASAIKELRSQLGLETTKTRRGREAKRGADNPGMEGVRP